jgi:acetylornithine/N-succinyldiaminopimelate aminotransferase
VATGAYLRDALEQTARRFELGEVRGQGLLLALALGDTALGPQIVADARDAGLLLNSPRPDCLRFMAALNVTRAEVDQMIVILREVLARVF